MEINKDKTVSYLKWIRFISVCIFYIGMGLGMAEVNGALDGPGFGYLDPGLKRLFSVLMFIGLSLYLVTRLSPFFLKIKVPSIAFTWLVASFVWIGTYIWIGIPLRNKNWFDACEQGTDARGCYGHSGLQKNSTEKIIWLEKGMKKLDVLSIEGLLRSNRDKYFDLVCDFYVEKCMDRDLINFSKSRFCFSMARKCEERSYKSGRDVIADSCTNSLSFEKLNSYKGNDVDITNKHGVTALQYNVSFHNVWIAKTLIERGANINHQDKSGNTALIYAIDNNDFDMVAMLLDKKADVKINNKDGLNAIDLAGKKASKDIKLILNQAMKE